MGSTQGEMVFLNCARACMVGLYIPLQIADLLRTPACEAPGTNGHGPTDEPYPDIVVELGNQAVLDRFVSLPEQRCPATT